MDGNYFLPEEKAPKLRDLNAIRLSNWYRVGRNLLVPVYRLEAIRKKHHDDERAKLAMFGYWLKNAPHCANQYVVQALVDSNETRAADFYCLTHNIDIEKCMRSQQQCSKINQSLTRSNITLAGPDKQCKWTMKNIIFEVYHEGHDRSEAIILDEWAKQMKPHFEKHDWHTISSMLDGPLPNFRYLTTTDFGEIPEIFEIFQVLFQSRHHTFQFACLDASKHSAIDQTHAQSVCDVLRQVIHTTCTFKNFISSSSTKYSLALIGSHMGPGQEARINYELQSIISTFLGCQSHQLRCMDYQGGKIIHPLDIRNTDSYLRQHIRTVVDQVIRNVSNKQEMPQSWYKFFFILRYLKEVISFDECKILANACGVPDDEVVNMLSYIHNNCGSVILHYKDVPKMKDIVIWSPNCVIESVKRLTSLFLYVEDHHQPHADIRVSGIATAELIQQLALLSDESDKSIPLESIIELLKYYFFLAELKDDRGYFMPCILKRNDDVNNIPVEVKPNSPAPLLLRFASGHVPEGTFTGLCTYLSQFWMLSNGKHYKNQITYLVGSNFCEVEFISRHGCIEICVHEDLDNRSVWDVCPRIVRKVSLALRYLQSRYFHLSDISFSFAFYCPGSKQENVHLASFVNHDDCHDTIQCLGNSQCLKQTFDLIDCHKVWGIGKEISHVEEEMDVSSSFLNEDVEEAMQLLNKSMAMQGVVCIRSVKTVFFGPPAVGKTSTYRRLTGEINNLSEAGPVSSSTGLSKPVAVLDLYHNTQKQSILVSSPNNWHPQSLDDQLGLILHSLSSGSTSNDSIKTGGVHLPPSTVFFKTPCSTNEDLEHMQSSTPNSPSYPSSFSTSHQSAQLPMSIDDVMVPLAEKSSSVYPDVSSTPVNKKQGYLVAISKYLKEGKWKNIQNVLEGITDAVTVHHIIDTGGQPEFFEILPLLLNGPALNLLFFSLTQELDEPYTVTYRHGTGPSAITYESIFTVREMLTRILTGISTQNSSNNKKSAALLFGTYRDKVQTKSDIEKLEASLLQSFEGSEFYYRDILRKFTDENGKASLIFPVDNMNGTVEEIQQLQKHIMHTVEGRFQPTPLPTSWAIFHLLIRYEFEEIGYCSLQEAIKIAESCQILQKDVSTVLKYFHSQFGTILYYPDVSALKDLVICDPNVIFKPITHLVVESFGANPDEPQTAKTIRRTGVIPSDLLSRVSALTQNEAISLHHIIKFLEYHHIISEVPLDGSTNNSYFMPCLLLPNHSVNRVSSQQVQEMNPAPLIITFSTRGDIPIGLFYAVIVELSQTQKWSLDVRVEQFKNKIAFTFDERLCTKVELISQLNYFEVQIESSASNDLCQEVRQDVRKAIDNVKSKFEHMKNIEVKIGFYCPQGLACSQLRPHFAVCKDEDAPERMLCYNMPCPCESNRSDLEPKHKIWFSNYEDLEKMEIEDDSSTSPSTSHGQHNGYNAIQSSPRINDLVRLLMPIAPQYDIIGTLLGVPMDTLGLDPYPQNHYKNLRATLQWWLDNGNNPANVCSVTWASIIKVIENGLPNYSVAQSIRNFLATGNVSDINSLGNVQKHLQGLDITQLVQVDQSGNFPRQSLQIPVQENPTLNLAIFQKQPQEVHLVRVLANIKRHWRSIGQALGISESDLESVSQKSKDPLSNLKDMLGFWRNTRCSLVTWGYLIESLEGPTVNQKKTAEDVRTFLSKPEIISSYLLN